MKTLKPIQFTLLAAAALFTHAAFAGKPGPPPPPPPSSGTVVLDYLYQGVADAANFGLTVAPSGTVYASGTAYVDDASSGWRGIVLGSSDAGASWSVKEAQPYPASVIRPALPSGLCDDCLLECGRAVVDSPLQRPGKQRR